MKNLLVALALCGTACGAGALDGGGALDGRDAVQSAPDDAGPGDAGPGDAGVPVPCGAVTCAAGEVCVRRYSGVDGGGGPSFVACVTPRGPLSCAEAWANQACAPTACRDVQGSTVSCWGQ
ncbi:MAG: hypothetical protein U0228_33325 [Myxococcaceae bacterium]